MDEQHQQGRANEPERPGERAVHGPGEGSRAAEPDLAQDRLRERAEVFVAGQEGAWNATLSEHDIKRLVHELQVHQVELEIQNEELRQAQIDLAASVERYTDLYDFAPIGYLSVSLDGQITRANLAAADMLRVERRHLTGKPLHRYIAIEDFIQYQAARRRLTIEGLSARAELRLRPTGGELFWARLEIVTRLDPTEGAVLWQVAISNIDAQKRAELLTQRVNEELEAMVQQRTAQLTLTNQQLVTEVGRRKDAEAELRQREGLLEQRVAERTAELAALLSVARDITSTLDIDSVLHIIANELERIVPYDGCGIFLLNGEMLTLVAYNGPLPREELLQSQTIVHDSPLLEAVVERREPVIIADMLADTPVGREWQATAGSLQRQLMSKSRAWMGIPLVAQGQPIGVLQLDHEVPGRFTEQHADLVLTLASQAAIAVVNARLFSLASHVAAIEERQRLARELHDSVAQTFYSIALAAHAARSRLHGDQEPVHSLQLVERRLNHILDLADVGLTEMKALIFDLQSEGIRRDGLVQALQRHLAALTARNDLRVEADLGIEPNVSLETKEAIYGIAREALQNVVRHASATLLSLKLSRGDNHLWVEVEDNGRGFTPESVGAQTLGLRSMRERAAAAGGSVEISSAPGQGALVRARIPLTSG